MTKNPFKQSPKDPERIPNVEALHAYLLETEENEASQFSTHIPDMPTRREICKNFFACNIWDVEPYLLDDLHNAKKSNNKKKINHIREMIRAASWASHGRTDTDLCLKLLKQLDLDRPEIHAAVKDYLCDEEIENAVNLIEAEVEKVWDAIAKNNASAPEAREKLHALRPIRDQLYFQRLYKILCAIGKRSA